jgi:HlyD family secretion protein
VKKLDDLRTRARNGELDRNAMREESQKIYTAIGVDPRIAGACRMREMRAQGGGQQSGGQPAAGQPAARQDSTRRGTQSSIPSPQLQLGNTERTGTGQRVRSALVFVAKGKSFEPRMVMLGAGNFDYTEVVSGLQEGEQVALLASLSLQAQRQQQNDRFRQGMGGVPGMSQNQSPGGRPGGGGGGGGPR